MVIHHPSNTKSPGPRPIPPYQVASEFTQPFGHNGHLPKIRVCAHLDEGELGPHVAYAEAYIRECFGKSLKFHEFPFYGPYYGRPIE